MANHGTFWTSDRHARAVKMAAQGLSTREIAEIIGGGRTKNMVISLLDRAGQPILTNQRLTIERVAAKLQAAEQAARAIEDRARRAAARTDRAAKAVLKRAAAAAERAKDRIAEKAAKLRDAQAALEEKAIVSDDGPPITTIFDRLPEITMTGCRWINGDVRDGGWAFCGQPARHPGESWCAAHRQRVFTKASL